MTLVEAAAYISLFKRRVIPLQGLQNHIPESEIALQEITRESFGWILWAWQVMGLISYYIPSVEPNTFINQIHQENESAWRLLKEISTDSGFTLYTLLRTHSLGLRYDTPSLYFGNQLQLIIGGE